jgi:excisionase family DNA binding protein
MNSNVYGKKISNKQVYTVNDIAQILGIGRTLAYKLVHKRYFKTIRIGNSIRISKSSFDEWFNKQETITEKEN